MANYFVSNKFAGSQQAITTTFKTQVAIVATSGALRRGKAYEMLLGVNGTPADNEIEWEVLRTTVAGTGTAATPNPLDPADVAALSTATVNYSAEPTKSLSVFDLAANQRFSFRWVASPGGELVWPATAANGLAFCAQAAAYTGTLTIGVFYQEQ